MDGQAETGPAKEDLGGYETVEALVGAHQTSKNQVAELESLKGRQGSEIGELRRDLSEAKGHIKGLETRNLTPVLTRAEIEQKAEAGEITEDEAANLQDEALISKMMGRTEKLIADQRAKDDHEKYVDQYMEDNPGYAKAYDAGLLNDDIRNGYTAEHAYDRHVSRENANMLKEKEAELKEKTTKAEADGVQKGVKVEQQKKEAGKVLGGGATSFSSENTHKALSRGEQRERARELVDRMRSKPG